MYNVRFGRPAAIAKVFGGSSAPQIKGIVSFFSTQEGTLVVAEMTGLPQETGECASGFLGFHIHEGGSCDGSDFIDTGGHFNPSQCNHPEHAGDLPPLLECSGKAFMAVLTDRFDVLDIIGRTVVIHGAPDDFTTQPSGNAGVKLACGVIRAN